MEFYVYIYYDPSRNNEPIYVGKGSKNRAWNHLKLKFRSPFVSRLIHMRNIEIQPIIGIYSGLDEELAHLLEIELIQKFGRKDLGKGTLLNLTDGGEGTSGAIFGPRPDDVRKRISIGNKGKHLSEETKRKLSLRKKGKPGTPHSIETKEKIRLGNIGKSKPNMLKGKTYEEIFGIEGAAERRNKNRRKI